MDAIKAIPKHLLIHDITIHKLEAPTNRMASKIIGAGTEIKSVRIEPSEKLIRGKNQVDIKRDSILFFDCKNSSPRDTVFVVDDIVKWNSLTYQVVATEPLYDKKKLHHYEIGLIKYGQD
ncbi:MAG: putative minor capsid protein [Eubacteriales bacterium]